MPEILPLPPSGSSIDFSELPSKGKRGRAGDQEATPFGLMVSTQTRQNQAQAPERPRASLSRSPEREEQPVRRDNREDIGSARKAHEGDCHNEGRLDHASDEDAPACRLSEAEEQPTERTPSPTDVSAGPMTPAEENPADLFPVNPDLPAGKLPGPSDQTGGVMTATGELPNAPMPLPAEVPVPAPSATVDAGADLDALAVVTALGSIGKDGTSAQSARVGAQGSEVPMSAIRPDGQAGQPATADAFAAITAKSPDNPAPLKSAAGESPAPVKLGGETPKAAAFADWINEFAQGQGAFHRSGDLVGSLDRAVAALPTPHAGQDALRPTPLQMLPIEIGMQAVRGVTKFQIRLDPAELGRVDVQLEFKQDGEVKANLVVDRVETLAMLKRDAHTLQQAFEQAGLKQSPDGMSFSLRNEGQQNREGQRQDGNGDGRRNWSPEDDALMGEVPPELAMRRVMIPNSSVDLMI